LAKRNIIKCLDAKDTIEVIPKVLSPFVTYSSGWWVVTCNEGLMDYLLFEIKHKLWKNLCLKGGEEICVSLYQSCLIVIQRVLYMKHRKPPQMFYVNISRTTKILTTFLLPLDLTILVCDPFLSTVMWGLWVKSLNDKTYMYIWIFFM
jgi:hypothetical protein